MYEVIVGIYTISDQQGNIVYVGKTINFKMRKASHYGRFGSGNPALSEWTRSQPVKPIIEMLEECEEQDIDFHERFWINQLHCMGFKLFNRYKFSNQTAYRGDKLSITLTQQSMQELRIIGLKFGFRKL